MKPTSLLSIAVLSLLLAWLPGCPSVEEYTAASVGGGSVEVSQVALDYRDLRRMTAEPVRVDPVTAALCTSPSQLPDTHGPHAGVEVVIYMNELAATAFEQPAGSYPVGAVIVKEKHALADASATDPRATPDGVGGMIKRPNGYDGDHGDWEYFYFERPADLEHGRLDSCVACHASAADRDHVFGDWADRREHDVRP